MPRLWVLVKMIDKQQKKIAQKLVQIAKNHPDYDPAIVKKEIIKLLDMAYDAKRNPLLDLWTLYQGVQKG